MDAAPCLTVLEQCRISAPPTTVGHRSLPLTFFDMEWLLFPPTHYLFFYEFQHSKSHFMDTIVPNLKHSLSLTFQHVFPFVSNLVVFPNPNHSSGDIKKPEIRHVEGDSVAVLFAECALDFDELTGNHPRKCENFYPLVPTLGDAVISPDNDVMVPVFSLQVTYFPDSGISIGMTNHHSLGDATTRFNFMKTWTSIIEHGGDQNESPPVFDRLIDIPRLDENKMRTTRLEGFYKPPSLVGPTDKVRATFVLTRTSINQLKSKVIAEFPSLEYISSFTTTCGYIWSCIKKSLLKMGEKNSEEDLEQFILAVDCRSRLDPAVPAAYFGNCVAPCVTTIKSVVLCNEKGFENAAKLIGESISKMVNNKDGILKDADKWDAAFKIPCRKIGVAGSLRLNYYDFDFGFGKPKKYEIVSMDYNGSISLNSGKKSSQNIEIGVCLPRKQMEVFACVFNEGVATK